MFPGFNAPPPPVPAEPLPVAPLVSPEQSSDVLDQVGIMFNLEPAVRLQLRLLEQLSPAGHQQAIKLVCDQFLSNFRHQITLEV